MNTTSPADPATRKTTTAVPFAARAVVSPTTLGLVKSFGFGDRFGLATPGHLAAALKFDFAPIFAQQSIRELERTQRTAQQVVKAAIGALTRHGYAGKWGADADHLKTPEHVDRTAAAGFCFFTIDPSEHVGKGTVTPELELAYLGRKFDVPNVGKLQFDAQTLRSAATKYGRALEHVGLMGRHIAKTMDTRPFEIEVSVDETSEPTSVLDHLFIGLELRRLAVPHVISVAPRFVGDFEKGIDYKGDLKKFEASLREHLEIARFCGPYKISIHSGSDKFAIYPIVGRVCGPLLHVKTSGTSYLEGLRVVARTTPQLFAEIVEFCRSRFETDRQSYHISTTLAHVKALPKFAGAREEPAFLDEVPGRQLLHVTFGSVLTHPTFKPQILETLESHASLHEELLERHLTKHLSLLAKG
jgi:tagaturonate epimerase